ncbi:MAG: aspartate-semialdehyde dehydrogenase [Phycisphaerae bacterium]|nr:aspartate-semialdehyde dehydrogenase [Phycisphaerae bacterium]
MNVAIVGATGAVGAEFLSVLIQRRFPVTNLRAFASNRSAGTRIEFAGRPVMVESLAPGCFDGCHLAFFSAGKTISREFAPTAVRAGAIVIDNSSAFRMQPDVPLGVPEINPDAIRGYRGIVAVPNCTAIILCMAVWPLHRAARLQRIVVSTYQAVSGAGARALRELHEQIEAAAAGRALVPKALPYPIVNNLFSHNTSIGPEGSNEEESKVIEETRRILGAPDLAISATCIRVPVPRAHSESINLTFADTLGELKARELLAAAPGVRVVDDREHNRFPMPIDASGGDDVLVGRIRADPSQPPGRGLSLFACGDQLRKGAALNAVQIAELVTNL